MDKEIKCLSYRRDFNKHCRNNLNKTIKETKSNYHESKLNACKDYKKSWEVINELLNNALESATINELIVDGEKVLDDHIAIELNKFFSSVGTRVAQYINPSDVDPLAFITPTSHNFQFQNISQDKIKNKIKQMKNTESSGYDKISVKLLQATGSAIVEPRTYIFNQSLETGIFPDDWKIAKVTPIYKSDKKTLCDNYRPISVISVVPKIFEKVVCEQLTKYLEQSQIITKFQSGIRANHSTETLLLHKTNNWLANMDTGLINGVLFLDLKKGFDTVNH